ncbi:MAG: C4-dicarboxylate ABC transporter substrate-binding protein, partial [Rhodobacteraceae bacterium]|nr:C4-dicarboxylate ABC transporter substrate-binding protein [Paracoccaceae bacterium]
MKHRLKAAVFCVAAIFGTASTAENAGIATSNPGSLFHNIGTAVANAANANGLNTTIQPATSPNQFIPFINSGGIEFGVANLQ